MNRYQIHKILKFLAYPFVLLRRMYIKHKINQLKSSPKELASFLYKRRFGREINWVNPTEWNEKLRWLSFNTDTSLWTQLADKYNARFYVEEKGYASILVKLLGVWDDASQINFNTLPDSFVIKTNHGCGEVVVVKDKRHIDFNSLRDLMNKYLRTPFGYETAEPHYLSIKPKIIAEELLCSDSTFSSSIVDYKFYCFNGEPIICGVFFNRNPKTHETSSVFYDMDWKEHPEWHNSNKREECVYVPKPMNFELMKKACYDLCKSMPFCRLDFYESLGQLYFGEFTFTPAMCTGGSLNPSMFMELGEKIKINNIDN